MAIYIKGMEMPKSCEECRYFIKRTNHISLDYKYDCINGAKALVFPNVYENIAFDCPLTEVPEPHGRLIDADKLADDLEADGKQFGDYIKLNCASWLRSESTPTVIEGSE